MASTVFKDKVTSIPTAWANDVNRVIYDLLQNPASLADVKSVLGLGILTEGGAIKILNGSIDQTPIGMFTPGPAKFTNVQITQPGTAAEDLATNGSVASAITNATKNYKDMATQSSGAVAITGGTLDGVSITNATGAFASIAVAKDAENENEVVRLAQLNAKMSTIPVVGTISSQASNAVNITGGNIDGVVIGSNVAAAARFTTVTVNALVGPAAEVALNGAGTDGIGFNIKVTSTSNKSAAVTLADGGSFNIITGATKVMIANGRLALGSGNDDGVNQLQVNGAATATKVTVTELVPAVDGELTPKKWVQDQLAQLQSAVQGQITNNNSTLGTISTQAANNVAITGGAINGTTIGAATPAAAYFTTATAKTVAGSGAIFALEAASASGYAGAGASLTLSDSSNQNFCVNFAATGTVALMTGTAAHVRFNGNGSVVVGASGSDDGVNKFQVYGGAKIKGKLTIGEGTALPSGTATPVIGTAAPALSSTEAKWVPVTIATATGDVNCVMPVWQLS